MMAATTGHVDERLLEPQQPARGRSMVLCFFWCFLYFFLIIFCFCKGSPARADAESVSTILRYLLLCANPEGRDVREGTAVQRGREEGGGAGGSWIVVPLCPRKP